MRSNRQRIRAAAIGLLIPLAIAVAYEPAGNPTTYRPGTVLILACVMIAIVGGFVASVVAAITSTAVLWWALTEPYHSIRLHHRADLFGIVVFAVSATGVVALARLAAARVETTKDAEELRFKNALDAMLDNVIIGSAIRSESGEIVDFLVDYINENPGDQTRRHTYAVVGQRVCDLSPGWRTSGMLAIVADVVETGEPFSADRFQWAGVTGDGMPYEGYWTMQIAKLGDGYISATRNVTEIVNAEKQAALAANLVEVERSSMALLQAAALPSSLPSVPGVSLAAVYSPADPTQPVGGDWYDAFRIDDDRLALVIADVAGHGREAATVMLQVRNIFRAIAVEHRMPADVLHYANEVTTRLNDEFGPFVTCCYAVYHCSTGHFEWAQAGHFSPVVLRSCGVAEYLPERPGPPLSIRRGQKYFPSEVTLLPGDRIFMFTDGMVERRNEILDAGLARFKRSLEQRTGLEPQQLVDELAMSIGERFDDLAMICLALDTVGSSPQPQ